MDEERLRDIEERLAARQAERVYSCVWERKAATQDVPDLIAEVRRLRKALEATEEWREMGEVAGRFRKWAEAHPEEIRAFNEGK